MRRYTLTQPTGRYTLRPPTSEAGDIEPWIELDPLGNVARTLTCAAGLHPRLHDILLEPDGSYRLLCDETRTMDLTSLGGVANARVTGTVVQHLGARGTVLFQWTPFDHFDLSDLDPSERAGANVNWTHGNALDIGTDGTSSSRSAISGRSPRSTRKPGPSYGASAAGATSSRSSIPPCRPSPASTACVRVRPAAWFSSTTSAIRANPGPNATSWKRPLVSFGTAGRVEEYDTAGRLTWRIEGNPGYVLRAQRIRSLYAPAVRSTR